MREAWKAHSTFNELPPRDIPVGTKVFYLAEPGYSPTFARYRHARFMPRWASRILLEITSVRIERVQDISEADAIAEGCGFVRPYNPAWSDMDMPREDFRELWDSINAKRGFGWDANPWTWVIEFKRVD